MERRQELVSGTSELTANDSCDNAEICILHLRLKGDEFGRSHVHHQESHACDGVIKPAYADALFRWKQHQFIGDLIKDGLSGQQGGHRF